MAKISGSVILVRKVDEKGNEEKAGYVYAGDMVTDEMINYHLRSRFGKGKKWTKKKISSYSPTFLKCTEVTFTTTAETIILHFIVYPVITLE